MGAVQNKDLVISPYGVIFYKRTNSEVKEKPINESNPKDCATKSTSKQ